MRIITIDTKSVTVDITSHCDLRTPLRRVVCENNIIIILYISSSCQGIIYNSIGVGGTTTTIGWKNIMFIEQNAISLSAGKGWGLISR